jgi:hypothetical protein
MATSVRSIFDMNADKVKFRGVGLAFTAAAGVSTTFDYKLTSARVIDGTQVIAKDHVFGDNIDFQVVDVDNILGYGAGTVLDNFGASWYLAADKQDQGHIRMPYSAELIANLYIRVVYHSVGGTNVSVKLNLFVHAYTA